LADFPETSALWHKLDARADTCTGQKCSSWDKCFITEMRRRAAESDIVIVNHHLFFADLGIKQQAEGAPDAGILPDAGVVIFDEAHELEDVAGSYFGISVSAARFEELCRDIENFLQRNRNHIASFSGAIRTLRERSALFFSLLPKGEGRFAFENRHEFLEGNGDELVAVQQALVRIASEIENMPSKPEEAFSFARRAQELHVQLAFVLEHEDPNVVFWIERRRFAREKQHISLQATPIDVGPVLREALWSKLDTAVLTSATLAVGGAFDYIRSRLGVDHARDVVLSSHFDYQNQALFYVPPDLPDARDPSTPARRNRVPHAPSGRRSEERASRRISCHAELRSFCDFLVLAGSGRAGRTTQLCHHRPPAIRRSLGPGGGGASQGNCFRWRKRILRISGAFGSHHSETRLWTPYPLAARSWSGCASR